MCFLGACFFAVALGLDAVAEGAGAATGAAATAGTDVPAGLAAAAGACANDTTAAVESKVVAIRFLIFNMVKLTRNATIAAAPIILSEPSYLPGLNLQRCGLHLG